MSYSSPNSKRPAIEPPNNSIVTVERSPKRARVDSFEGAPTTFKLAHQQNLNSFTPHLKSLNSFLSTCPTPTGLDEEKRWHESIHRATRLSAKSFYSSSACSPYKPLERKRGHSPSADEAENGNGREKLAKRPKRSHKNGDMVVNVAGKKRPRNDRADQDVDSGPEGNGDIEGRCMPGREDIGLKRPRTTYFQEGDPEIEYQSSIEYSDDSSDDESFGEGYYHEDSEEDDEDVGSKEDGYDPGE